MPFNRTILTALLPGLFLITACHLSKKTAKQEPVTMPEINISANNPLDIYRAAATKEWELIHTDIDIRFHIKERTADAVAHLTLHPYYYATDSVVLDAKSMKIISVKNDQSQSLAYRYDTAQLVIRLPKNYKKEDTLHLTIQYTAMPYALAVGGSSAITEDRGLYFVNADGAEPYQPIQIWTQGETESNSHWFPTFDKPNFRSAFTITMHVPDSFKTLSNGAMVNSTKEQNGLRADTWKQDIPIPPYLVMMAIGNFAVTKDSWKGKEVNYYVPIEYGAYAKDIFLNTPEMIDFFSKKLGMDFPWNKYSQVVTYDYVSGAMENVSASLFGSFILKDKRQIKDDNNDYIVAHELFHQWFGDYVTAESWSNLTLNESFANYSEQLWLEHKYGKTDGQVHWYDGLRSYLGQSEWNDAPLVRYHYHSGEDMFDRISYQKGGLILHYLRQLTGDQAFFDALNLYLKQNALHSAEAAQLRIAFEQVTGKDWHWFFDQWYYRGGHPKLEVSYIYDDNKQVLTVNVLQTQSDTVGLYQLPLKALIINGNKVSETDWLIAKKREQFTYPYLNGARPVIVPDAGHWLPGEINDKKSAGAWLAQYQYSNDHLSKRYALKACASLKNNDTAMQVIDLALTDKDPLLRNGAVNIKGEGDSKKFSPDFLNTLRKIAADDPDNKTRASALRLLGNTGNIKFTSLYEQGIADSSYLVAQSALYALDRVNHKRAVEYARNLKPETMKGNGLLSQAALVIAKDGQAEDYNFFEQKTLHLFEGYRMAFLNSFQEYLVNVKDEAIYQKGIAMLQKLAISQREQNGFYTGAIIFNVSTYAKLQKKIATDKALKESWERKSTSAATAWEAYKKTVTDEKLKTQIGEFEKEAEK